MPRETHNDRESDALIRKLKDDLLLRSIKEWRVDQELGKKIIDGALVSPNEKGWEDGDKIEERAIRAVGRRQALDEYMLRKAKQIDHLREDSENSSDRLRHLSEYILDILRPFIDWDSKMYTRYCRVYGQNPESLAEEILEDGKEREEWAIQVAQRVTRAGKSSTEVLEKLRLAENKNHHDIQKIREGAKMEASSIREHWEASLIGLEEEYCNLEIVNREQRFHLKRGSNYKTKSPARDRDTIENEERRTATNSILYPSEGSPFRGGGYEKLSQRKWEEIEHAEEALEADKEALKHLSELAKRRASERAELIDVRDMLLKEVDAARLALLDGSKLPFDGDMATIISHYTKRHRSTSPSPTSTRRGYRSPTPTPPTATRRALPSPIRSVPGSIGRVPSHSPGRTATPRTSSPAVPARRHSAIGERLHRGGHRTESPALVRRQLIAPSPIRRVTPSPSRGYRRPPSGSRSNNP